MEVAAFVAQSLDGFIAGKGGDLTWLEKYNSPDATDDHGYSEFVAPVSTIIMGRNTFEKVASFPDWPYSGKRVIVLSSSLKQLPERFQNECELYSGSLEELISAHSNETRIYIDGGKTICSFMREKLVDRLIISVIPETIGEGIPLFDTNIACEMVLESVKSYETGIVQLAYRIKKD